jgi:hypothetical protein
MLSALEDEGGRMLSRAREGSRMPVELVMASSRPLEWQRWLTAAPSPQDLTAPPSGLAQIVLAARGAQSDLRLGNSHGELKSPLGAQWEL